MRFRTLPNTAYRKQFIWMFAMLAVFAVLMLVFRPPLPNIFALLGILLAIGGAGWLYWEPILTEEDVAEFARMMMNVDRDFTLTSDEKISLMLFSLLSSLLIGFAAWVAYLRQWSSSAVTSLAVVVIACVAFVGAYYVFAKLVGLMIVRRAISAASLETYEERVSFVRAQMRTWGFACLLFGGVLQIPLIMVFN